MKCERVIDLVAYLVGVEILGREAANRIMRANPLYRATYRGVEAFGKTHAQAIGKLFEKFIVDMSEMGITAPPKS